eukprot:COSAG02_NODE_2011_length_10119_cov_11.569960_13_plen_235_part_00
MQPNHTFKQTLRVICALRYLAGLLSTGCYCCAALHAIRAGVGTSKCLVCDSVSSVKRSSVPGVSFGMTNIIMSPSYPEFLPRQVRTLINQDSMRSSLFRDSSARQRTPVTYKRTCDTPPFVFESESQVLCANHSFGLSWVHRSACCKHYVANSMESTTETDGESFTRHTIDANISMQDLVDSYMPPFQSCVEVGKVSSLMCSYNSVNGYPSCANHWLLQEVARDTWHFDGYITR